MKIDVKGKLESSYVEAPFDQAKKELESNGYRIISLSENAKLRIQEGKNAFVSQNGNWTAEDFIYLPNKQVYLTKNSPIMKNAEKATNCHRKGEEFYLTSKQVDYALTNAVKIKDTKIPTNRFGEAELTNFCFGESAKAYGEFLKNAGIDDMPVYLCNTEKKPFARKLWFWDLGSGSGLVGGGDLGYDSGARGVHESNAEGVAQKIEAYTIKDISNALKEANLSGIEKVLLEKLKK